MGDACVKDTDLLEVNKLILELLDGSISRERFSLLDRLIAEQPEAAGHYLDFIALNSALCKPGAVGTYVLASKKIYEPDLDETLWRALAENEKRGKAVEVEDSQKKLEAEPELVKKIEVDRRSHQISKFSLSTAIISTAALIMLLFYVWLQPPRLPVVASLTGQIDTVWDESGLKPVVGQDLRTGSRKLLKGYAKITFDKGAEVLVQGPAEFALETADQMFLLQGRLSCKVPTGSMGFIVRTPCASIVDYGTEFGVTAKASGETEAHVFEGNVELRGGSDPARFKGSKKLIAGMAGRVDITGEVVETTFEARPRQFVRQIPEREALDSPDIEIDLADVVGGGDGFGSSQIGLILDPLNGGFISFAELKARGWYITEGPEGAAYISDEFGPTDFVTLALLPYVDGIFIPDGGEGAVQISSTGLAFNSCPDTGGGFWAGISNHGRIKNDDGYVNWVEMRVGRKFYGTRENPGIFMHANIGITFDLDKVRSAFPEAEIRSFSSLCGLNMSTPDVGNADFYVLVDGQVRFKSTGMNARMLPKPVSVEIAAQDRFLTLVTTDANKDNTADGCVFALPKLELMRKE
jgi:hypothetical protein